MAGERALRQRSPQPSAGGARNIDGDNGRQRSPQPRAGDARNIDVVLGAIASCQQGIIARDQLFEAGLSTTAIDHWVRRGRLYVRHHGVYALGHEAMPPYAEEMAALLACRPRAVVGFGSAAHMWGLRPRPTHGAVDIIVVERKVRSRPGIRVRRVASLMRCDVREIDGVTLTSPARTIYDLAGELEDDRELELALHEATARGLISIDDVRAVLERYPRRPGAQRLRALCVAGLRPSATASGGEEHLYRSLRRAGMPEPSVNHKIGPFTIDFYWAQAGLGVEVDGFNFHSTRPRIERDHRKDHYVRERGILLLRFTGRQVRQQLEWTLVTIAREYERRLRAAA